MNIGAERDKTRSAASGQAEDVEVRPRPDASHDPALLGRYRLHEVLGRGAFAIVYRATQVDIARTVALKVFLLPPEARQRDARGHAALARFLREARMVASLRHPHSVTLYDFDKTDRGILYMAFEFIDGRTLSQLLKASAGGLPVSRAVHIVRQVAASLQEAHDLGIVHRDLKPGNIMLTDRRDQDDFVKVLDFGIAKLVNSAEPNPEFDADRSNLLEILALNQPQIGPDADLTLNGRIVGTPRYLPPEQIQGLVLSQTADIYALGLILHEAICGRPANPGRTTQELLTWHLEDLPVDIPPGFQYPPGVAWIVQRATRRDPAERYASCAELLADLDRLDDQGHWRQPPQGTRTAAVAINVTLLLLLTIVSVVLVGEHLQHEADAHAAAQARALAPPTAPTPRAAQAAADPPASPAPLPAPSLEIGSLPEGAEVFIGPMRLGTTPLVLTLEDRPEQLSLTLKLDGHLPQTVLWRADGQGTRFPVRLRPDPASTPE